MTGALTISKILIKLCTLSTNGMIFMDCEAGEIVHLVASVCLSVLSHLNRLTYETLVKSLGDIWKIIPLSKWLHVYQSNFFN